MFNNTKCKKCGKELRGVYAPYGAVCEQCAGDKATVINAERGRKVVFAYPENGTESERYDIKAFISVGNTYTVDRMDVGRFHSSILLDEVPQKAFNSVFFELEKENEPLYCDKIPSYLASTPMPKVKPAKPEDTDVSMTIDEAILSIKEFGLYHAERDLPHSIYAYKAFQMAIAALLEQKERTNEL